LAYKITPKQTTAAHKTMSASNFEDDQAVNAPTVLGSLTDRLDSSASALTEMYLRLVHLADRLFGANPDDPERNTGLENGSAAELHRLEYLACRLSDQVAAFARAIERLERL
jgi:hypothetical protein